MLQLWAVLKTGGEGSGVRRIRISGEAFATNSFGRIQRLAPVFGEGLVSVELREDGWRVDHRELLHFHDPVSGVPLRQFQNPFTGRTVAAEPLELRAVYRLGPTNMPTCRIEGDTLAVQEPAHGFAEPFDGSSQLLTLRTASRVVRPRVCAAAQFTRTLSWPNWMGMPDAPAPCLIVGQVTA